MSQKKDCMFQYSITKNPGYFSSYDTGLITLATAKKLWEKHLPDFIAKLLDDSYEPEMGIWINCKNDTDYHTCKPHADNNTKTRNGRLYEITETEITI
jgi:hypothetical protein